MKRIIQPHYRKMLFRFFHILFVLVALALLTAAIHHGETKLFPEPTSVEPEQLVMPILLLL